MSEPALPAQPATPEPVLAPGPTPTPTPTPAPPRPRPPDGVTLAAVLSLLGGVASLLAGIVAVVPVREGTASITDAAVALLLGVGLLFTGYGLLRLRKWAWWVFLALAVVRVLDIASGVGLVLLDKAPRDSLSFVDLLKGGIGVAWVVYFSTAPVRRAFGIGSGLVGGTKADADGAPD